MPIAVAISSASLSSGDGTPPDGMSASTTAFRATGSSIAAPAASAAPPLKLGSNWIGGKVFGVTVSEVSDGETENATKTLFQLPTTAVSKLRETCGVT